MLRLGLIVLGLGGLEGRHRPNRDVWGAPARSDSFNYHSLPRDGYMRTGEGGKGQTGKLKGGGLVLRINREETELSTSKWRDWWVNGREEKIKGVSTGLGRRFIIEISDNSGRSR
jgi:hypothetical protein